MSGTYTYEWVIENVQVAIQHDSLEEIVVAANWRYQGTDGSCTTSVYGLTEFDMPEANNFIPFNQVTSQQVVDWINAQLSSDAITGFQNQIAAECATHNYTVVTKQLVA